MTKREKQELELSRVRSSQPPGRQGMSGRLDGLAEDDEVKGVCPESETSPENCVKCEGADSLRNDAGHADTRARDECVSGLPGSQIASSRPEDMEQPGRGPRLLGDELPEYPTATPPGSPGDGQSSGMGDGLAMKRGNARGVKVPTHQNLLKEKTSPLHRERNYAVETDLQRIRQKASGESKLVFNSLYHHVYDVAHLRACYETLDGRKAVGIDGVDKRVYGEKLEENLADLSQRLRKQGYRPQPKRRSYIPKAGSEKGRPLGISNLEDKIVEKAVKNVLEAIYEADFEESSYGYRPARTQHDCLDELGRTIQQERVSFVVEADVRSFFDKVNHAWLMKFLRHRIGDERLLRLVERMLKAGILEDGLVYASEAGTPQGSILSPLLSNVYLHYVLDLWFNKRVRKWSQGEAYLFRYADDFVACFQYRADAMRFRELLEERLEGFGLQLAEEKTRCLKFGRFARDAARKRGKRPEGFTFLGFDHYCGKTRTGKFKVKRRTARKKLQASLRKFTEWCQSARRWMTKGEMLRLARQKIIGHLNYYAITDNSSRCGEFVYQATRILFKWLNRKSQRRCYTWEGFRQVMKWLRWPTAKIRNDLNPFRGMNEAT